MNGIPIHPGPGRFIFKASVYIWLGALTGVVKFYCMDKTEHLEYHRSIVFFFFSILSVQQLLDHCATARSRR